MSTPNESLVARFLLTKLSKSLSAAYDILATLKYPIPDKRSLATQLEGLVREDPVREDSVRANQDSTKLDLISLNLIRGSLGVFDFPIETPQSALEKFDARVSAPNDGNSQDSKAREAMERPYDLFSEFSPSCAAMAMRAYLAALPRGESFAISAGRLEGQWCQRNFGSLAGPCFDVALRAYFEARGSGSSEPLALAAGHDAGLGCSSFPITDVPPPPIPNR